MEEIDKKTKIAQSRILKNQAWKGYEFDTQFKPWDGVDPLGVHTTAEMLQCLESRNDVELDARVLGIKENQWLTKSISKEKFKEAFIKDKWEGINFREADFFARDQSSFGSVGQDFTPLLGGPFFKNLYYYQDYIRMHSESFFAYHHDPFARAIVQITRDFVLGTGYEMQCDTSDTRGKIAMAAWQAFEDANDFQEQVDQFVVETSIYGESMFYELPNNQSKIVYNLAPGDRPPTGIIPRVRIIDPSNIVEIVGYPEDITRPLLYIWLTPTQYQIFGGGAGGVANNAPPQPTLKFIYRQIPAEQMMHYKVNSVSNEKRGRSDFFPVLSYLKRLRDSVDYALITLQKVSAYSLDTEIDGDQADIDGYVQNQAAIGTIPPAGSEFVHDTKVKRTYMGNQHGGGHTSDAFQWALSCIAAGTGIPVSYFGTHLSGGTTKASALVATEPVAKKMEKRRELVNRMLRKMWKLVMKRAGLPDIDCDVVFPEMITQDRSAKLKDILLCETARWISPSRAASMAAMELAIDDYNYEKEIQDMGVQLPQVPMPLTDPANNPPPGSVLPPAEPEVSGLTSDDKKAAADNDRHL